MRNYSTLIPALVERLEAWEEEWSEARVSSVSVEFHRDFGGLSAPLDLRDAMLVWKKRGKLRHPLVLSEDPDDFRDVPWYRTRSNNNIRRGLLALGWKDAGVAPGCLQPPGTTEVREGVVVGAGRSSERLTYSARIAVKDGAV